MTITRYDHTTRERDMDTVSTMVEDATGVYVTYDDHLAAIAAKDAANARLRGEVARWIPCAERMPDPDVYVLIYLPRIDNCESRYFSGNGVDHHGGYWGDASDYDRPRAAVSHWQPLPPAPRCDGETGT